MKRKVIERKMSLFHWGIIEIELIVSITTRLIKEMMELPTSMTIGLANNSKQDQGDLGRSPFLCILITIWTDLEQFGTMWTNLIYLKPLIAIWS